MSLEYWREFSYQDRPRIKTFVILTLLLATLKSASVAAIVWHKLIAGFASFIMASTSSPWYARTDPLIAIVIILLAQTFFLLRLSALLCGRMRLVLIPIVAAMLLSFGSHIGIVVKNFLHSGSYADVLEMRKVETTGIAGLIATDFMISFCFCFVLLRSKTGMPRTDSLIARLIVLSWTTALIPTICDLVKLVTYLALLRKSSAFITFSHMLPKLYAVAMLVTLNVRSQLRNEEQFHLSTDYQLSTVLPGPGPPSVPGLSQPDSRARTRFNLNIRDDRPTISCTMQFAHPSRGSDDLELAAIYKTVDELEPSGTGEESQKWTGGTSSDVPGS